MLYRDVLQDYGMMSEDLARFSLSEKGYNVGTRRRLISGGFKVIIYVSVVEIDVEFFRQQLNWNGIVVKLVGCIIDFLYGFDL